MTGISNEYHIGGEADAFPIPGPFIKKNLIIYFSAGITSNGILV
jgi:hypothetical protein